MDSGKPRLQVVTAIAPIDGRLEMAATLERVAAQLRSGEVIADQGVLVMRNNADGSLHQPVRLGLPSAPTELMGLLAYAQARTFHDEIVP